MRDLKNNLTPGKNKKTNSKRTKSFGYQVLGFGAGGSSVSAEFDYLVIAGGGGAENSIGGGGGAGGYRTSFPGGTKIELTGGDTITVGAGGARGYPSNSAAVIAGIGQVSTAGDITSAGGGTQNGSEAYPTPNNSANNLSVRSGGSGAGGGHQFSYTVGAGNVPPTSPSQGNPGGGPSGTWGGSGGGGAAGAGGGQGSNAYSSPGGTGGTGSPSSITGSGVSRAGGGGGGAFVQGGSGGPASSGGGAGGSSPGGNGSAGSANTGGGGGGRSGDSTNGHRNNGGSGLIVLSLATGDAPAGIGISPGSNSVTTSGGRTILTFNVTGTLNL